MADFVVSQFYYWVVVILMMLGLYAVFATGNMVKRLVGLGVFQTSVFLFYISLGKVAGGLPPILPMKSYGGSDAHGGAAGGYGGAEVALRGGHEAAAGVLAPNAAEFSASAVDGLYSNPLPHVLILTAIVVGVATLSVGLALVVRIREAYGSIEDDDINAMEYDAELEGGDA